MNANRKRNNRERAEISEPVRTDFRLQIPVKMKISAAVIVLFFFLIPRLSADTLKEYIYLDGKAVAVETDVVQCTYDISPSGASPAAGGGSGSVSVTSSHASCPWTAASNATSWITVTGGSSGSGNGTVSYTVSANTGPARSGTITIAGKSFTVNQPSGCTYGISPSSASPAAGGGSGSVSVTSSHASCSWTAASNATSWIAVTGGSSGSGNGTVSYTVSANNTGSARTGTITIAGNTFTVNQPPVCTYIISPSNASPAAGGGSGSVSVNVAGGCSWTAASNATSWITVTGGSSGSGNGTVNYTVSANTGPARSGTITIAGQPFTVNQPTGCTYGISSASVNMVPNGGSGSVTVNRSNPSCPQPTVTSNDAWITASVNSSGNATYSAPVNYGTDRKGTVTIGGNTFTVTQNSGAACANQHQACNSDIEMCPDTCYAMVMSEPMCQWNPSMCFGAYLICLEDCEITISYGCTYHYNQCMAGK